MRVTINIFAGGDHREPTVEDIDRNICVLDRYIAKSLSNDDVSLIDTQSILVAIRRAIVGGKYET